MSSTLGHRLGEVYNALNKRGRWTSGAQMGRPSIDTPTGPLLGTPAPVTFLRGRRQGRGVVFYFVSTYRIDLDK